MSDESMAWTEALKDALRDMGVPEEDLDLMISEGWDEAKRDMDVIHIDYGDGTSVDIEVPLEKFND